jgi:hypothetical protein
MVRLNRFHGAGAHRPELPGATGTVYIPEFTPGRHGSTTTRISVRMRMLGGYTKAAAA